MLTRETQYTRDIVYRFRKKMVAPKHTEINVGKSNPTFSVEKQYNCSPTLSYRNQRQYRPQEYNIRDSNFPPDAYLQNMTTKYKEDPFGISKEPNLAYSASNIMIENKRRSSQSTRSSAQESEQSKVTPQRIAEVNKKYKNSYSPSSYQQMLNEASVPTVCASNVTKKTKKKRYFNIAVSESEDTSTGNSSSLTNLQKPSTGGFQIPSMPKPSGFTIPKAPVTNSDSKVGSGIKMPTLPSASGAASGGTGLKLPAPKAGGALPTMPKIGASSGSIKMPSLPASGMGGFKLPNMTKK